MSHSRYFRSSPSSRGLKGDVANLHKDTEDAFVSVEEALDTVGGGDSGPTILQASGSISAHRAVKILPDNFCAYCSSLVLADMPMIVGVSLTAGSNNDPIEVQTVDGEISEPSWSWTPSAPIYCGPNGVLTQTFDHSWAWVRIVGVAIDRTTLWFRLRAAVVQ